MPSQSGLTFTAGLRVAWALLSVFVVESFVFGLSALPAVFFWEWHFRWNVSSAPLRVILLSMAFIPSYLLFTLALTSCPNSRAWTRKRCTWESR